MTPIILLERLAEFVEENISDIKLQVRVTNTKPGEEKERAAEVHKMRLKKKEDKQPARSEDPIKPEARSDSKTVNPPEENTESRYSQVD